ncbi:sulfatase [Rubritalea tangerina]|uniref:Sulfatase n=1 Tax=Rubritalea tangerina TaxID=430798 RepID=A0ABW4ZFZ9_9BACT
MKRTLTSLVFLISLTWAHAAQRPNILWIFSEDLSPYFGCYGNSVNRGHTPTVDQMAKNGVLFTRTFMPAPVCSAARSAIITGVFQTTTGTHQHRSSRHAPGVVPPPLRIHLPKGMKTIPEHFRDAGYFTFNSGKDDYNFHYDRRALYSVGTKENYEVGMNGWQGNFARHSTSITKDTWNARPDKKQPWFGQIMLWGGKAGHKHVRKGDKLAAEAVPLPPYFPNTKAHRSAWTLHHNAARGADHQVEQILQQLKSDGELDNTIVFFFSDHGNNQSLRGKQFCYEDGLHVPLIILGNHPSIRPGTTRSECISGLDIPATSLALAGIPLPKYLDGSNLLDPNYAPKKWIISARDRCDYTIDRIRSVRSDKFRYIRNYFPERPLLQAQYRDNAPTVKDLKNLHASGKLSKNLSELWFGTRPSEELYDIAKDPHQMHNLASNPQYQTTLTQHRDALNQWINSSGDKGQSPEDPKQLKATFDLWKNKPIFKNAQTNPEYKQFR